MIFQSWTSLARVVLTAVLAYSSLVVLLRVSGKRTLSKLNAFDLVVTVALGSTLASVIVTNSVPLAEGVAALATLVGMQYVVAWLSTRWRPFDRVAKSEPRVLFYRGAFAREAMRDERIADGEVLSAIRKASVASLDEVEAVVLESSGDLAVLKVARNGASRTAELEGVRFDGAPGGRTEHARG